MADDSRRPALRHRAGTSAGTGLWRPGAGRQTRLEQLPRWIEGRPRALVDSGGGAALRFGEAGATVSELDVILLTRLQADDTSDLPALIKSSSFEARTRPLPVYGPAGNKFMPSTVTFVHTLFDSTRGAYRSLGDFLSPLTSHTYKLQPHDVGGIRDKLGVPHQAGEKIQSVFANGRLRATVTAVNHGSIPALAWRIEANGKNIIFSGDADGAGGGLDLITRQADILIASNDVPEGASGAEGDLSMPPQLSAVSPMRAA